MAKLGETQPIPERLARFITVCPDSGCWLWNGYIDKDGYGRIDIRVGPKGKRTKKCALAHRVSFAQYVKNIPDGYDVDHKCKVRNCINPDHLQLRYYKFHRGTSGVLIQYQSIGKKVKRKNGE